MSHTVNTNWNEAITLCTWEYRQAENKVMGIWVNTFDPTTSKRNWQKAWKDHELCMRCLDAALLHALIDDLLPYLERFVDNRDFYSNQATEALQLLRITSKALTPNCENLEQFSGLSAYSTQLLYLAAGYLKMSLETLDVFTLKFDMPRNIKTMHKLLNSLASEAEKKYYIEVYENAN